MTFAPPLGGRKNNESSVNFPKCKGYCLPDRSMTKKEGRQEI